MAAISLCPNDGGELVQIGNLMVAGGNPPDREPVISRRELDAWHVVLHLNDFWLEQLAKLLRPSRFIPEAEIGWIVDRVLDHQIIRPFLQSIGPFQDAID